MRLPTPQIHSILFLAILPGILTCSTPDAEGPIGHRAVNPTLQIAIASVPAPFRVIVGEGPVMELRAPGDAGQAVLTIEATAETTGGINLVVEAEAMKEWFEQQPEGQYFGNLELGTPLGPAFTSRGSYLLNGEAVEEIRVFSLHPSANRMLRWTYRYPPGEGKERLQQLANVLGEIEALASSDQVADPGSSVN